MSTSKVQLMLWIFAIPSALLILYFYGKDFTALELQTEYLFLLGSPAAAALLAKTFTSTKVSNGTVESTVAEEPSQRDVVTDNDGNTDLFDFQYFLFNVLLFVVFVYEMYRTLSDPSRLGDEAYFLPPLPLSLVGLTNVSAAGYVAKKGLEAARPILQGAYPSVAAAHDTVRLTGRHLRLTSAASAGEEPPQVPAAVAIGGRPAGISSPLSANPQGFDEITVHVPADVPPGRADVQFTRADGAISEPLQFEVTARGPKVLSVSPNPVVLKGDTQEITIAGSAFDEPDPGAGPQTNRITLGGVSLTVPNGRWTSERISAQVLAWAQAKQQGLAVPGENDLIVVDRHGRSSSPQKVKLAELTPTITSVRPAEHIVLDHEPKEIEIIGTNFGVGAEAEGVVALDGRPLDLSNNAQWEDDRVRAQLPPLSEARQMGFVIPGEYDLIVEDRYGRRSNAARLRLDWLAPVITGVYPPAGQPGQQVRLFGQNLTVPDVQGIDTSQVLFDNITGSGLIQRGDGKYEVCVPQSIDTGTRNIKFVRADGATTGVLPFQVVEA